jgi:hypothetical protein
MSETDGDDFQGFPVLVPKIMLQRVDEARPDQTRRDW